jgi:hypothetical protein
MSFFILVCDACSICKQCLTSGKNKKTVESPKGTAALALVVCEV